MKFYTSYIIGNHVNVSLFTVTITFAFCKVQSSMGRHSYIDNHGINALALVSIIVKIMLV